MSPLCGENLIDLLDVPKPNLNMVTRVLKTLNPNPKHYGDMKDFQEIYEPLFDQYGVDFVITGHVHACNAFNFFKKS